VSPSPTQLPDYGQVAGPTIQAMIRTWAERSPEAVAIAAPGRAPRTYSGLFGQLDSCVRQLNELGVGRGDRLALVLPNGPEMAVAFLAAACAATCAPLNPDYRTNEFEFLLADLDPRAIVLVAGSNTPAREVAVPGLPARTMWR